MVKLKRQAMKTLMIRLPPGRDLTLKKKKPQKVQDVGVQPTLSKLAELIPEKMIMFSHFESYALE